MKDELIVKAETKIAALVALRDVAATRNGSI
jgi:hypothetical protein